MLAEQAGALPKFVIDEFEATTTGPTRMMSHNRSMDVVGDWPSRLERVLIDALMPEADAELIDTPDWVQLSTPSRDDHPANGVYLARLAPEKADARIAAVKAAYAARGAEFRWLVGPSSAPADLPLRLERAGLRLQGAALGMVLEVPDRVPVPEGVELRAVGRAEIPAYAELSARVWQRGPDFREAVVRVSSQALADDTSSFVGSQRSWMVFAEGEPVGVTTLRLLPELGYFQGAAVLPRWRRRGLYRAMLHHRLALLRELGIAHAVIWAHEHSSAPACRKAGFVPHCRAVFYEMLRSDAP